MPATHFHINLVKTKVTVSSINILPLPVIRVNGTYLGISHSMLETKRGMSWGRLFKEAGTDSKNLHKHPNGAWCS